MRSSFRLVPLSLFAIITLAACKKTSNTSNTQPHSIKNSLVYVYKNDSTDGAAFKSLLQLNGCSVTLIDKSAVAAFNYANYKMIVIGGNSDSLQSHDNWDTAAAAVIMNTGKPCLLLGEGGFLFGGAIKDTVNWAQSAGNLLTSFVALNPSSVLYKQPKTISVPADSTIILYSTVSQVESFYLKAPPLANVVLIGRATSAVPSKYYPLLTDNSKYATFGYYDNMNKMTATGKDFFVNYIYFVGNLTL
jgi:hypothetical protein